MTRNQYRALDLAIFTILAMAFEFINYYASANIGTNVYVFLSYSVVLTLISLYRWGPWGLIVGVGGGFASIIVQGEVNLQYICIYVGANLSMIIPWLLSRLVGYKRVKKNFLLSILYLVIGYLVVNLTRSLIWMAYGENFVNIFLQYFTIESMSMVISLIILLISRTKNGIFTNMDDYLKDQWDIKTNPMRKLRELHEDPYYNPTAEVIEEQEFNDCNIMEDGTLSKEDLEKLQQMYDKKENKDNGKEKHSC